MRSLLSVNRGLHAAAFVVEPEENGNACEYHARTEHVERMPSAVREFQPDAADRNDE